MNRYQIDNIRDAAFKIKNSDPSLAFDLISIVHEYRPSGPAITKLFHELKNNNNIVTVSLIGNCQVTPLCELLKGKNKRIKILKVIEAHLYKKSNGIIYNFLDNSDYIITQNIGESFDEISTKLIKDKYQDKVIRITNLFYKGYHQDWTYIPMIHGIRLQSPIGDYHNKTVIDGFIDGLSPDQVLKNIYSYDFNKMQYDHIAEDSFNELKKREENVDIKMTELLKNEFSSKTECFHSFNHPTKHILNIEANKILEYLNIDNLNKGFTGECLNNVILRTNPIVSKRTQNDLKKGNVVVEILGFINESYNIYIKNPDYVERYKEVYLNSIKKT